MNLQVLLDQPDLPALELTGIAEHSGEVDAGYAFLAVAANDDDLTKYCNAAVQQGAQVILYDADSNPPKINQEIELVAVDSLVSLRGELAARFYADPSAELQCVGITGTNGKTSVAYHIADLVEKMGLQAGYCGTLGWGQLNSLQTSGMTTANAVALQRQLGWMRDQHMQVAAMEVSSHALAQHRADAVHFDVGVFTNLTRDHLDYHGTQEQYAAAKQRLFSEFPLRTAVINVDDEFGCQLARSIDMPVVTYGQQGQWRWQITPLHAGLRVQWHTPTGAHVAQLPVLADYAVANITAAMVALNALGYANDKIFAALERIAPVPGRMEVISGAARLPTVVVDYAHTPDALAKVLDALRPFSREKLICVVGCGGDRDAGKRPLMGKAACAGADEVWFTSDNPRSESPGDIIVAMVADLSANQLATVNREQDRRLAIDQAIRAASANDVVLVAGKGHEDYQEVDGVRMDFDDRQVVHSVLAQLEGES